MNRSSPLSTCAQGPTKLRLALTKAGCRFTKQRAAVYDFLCSVPSHPTAEEVFAAVRCQLPSISLATVYKALEALVQAGMVHKLTYVDGPSRFDSRVEAHYHLHCARTHQIRDVPIPHDPHLIDKLDPHVVEVLRQQGFQVTGYQLELLGYFQNAP